MKTFRLTLSFLFPLVMVLAVSRPATAQGRIVSCSSNDMHRHYCEIGPNDGVRVANQHSEARCVQGQTYGVRGSQMWVDHGCRADFMVISDRRGSDHDGPGYRGRDHHGPPNHDSHDDWNNGGSSRTVYCASDNMRRNYCDVGPSRSIRMVRKRSDAACDLNRTYGFDRNRIWVDRGCRAEFEVFGR